MRIPSLLTFGFEACEVVQLLLHCSGCFSRVFFFSFAHDEVKGWSPDGALDCSKVQHVCRYVARSVGAISFWKGKLYDVSFSFGGFLCLLIVFLGLLRPARTGDPVCQHRQCSTVCCTGFSCFGFVFVQLVFAG